MRRALARYSAPASSVHAQSRADFITNTPELEFSAQIAVRSRVPQQIYQARWRVSDAGGQVREIALSDFTIRPPGVISERAGDAAFD
jgi:hypothetical protein